MYTILDKHGNPRTDKDGNPIEHNGTYADDYAELRKQAPVTIIQHTTLPDEDGTTSYPVHIGTPGQQAHGCGKIARYCVIAILAALLTASCDKTAANGNSAIENLETGMYCEESLSDPSDPLIQPDTVIDLAAEWEACYKLAHAFAIVESNDNPKAINHRENAVGLLQIRPIMVRQANQIVGEELYELSDREDSLVSLGIFHTVMSELNPSLDIDRAIEIWNPNASTEYRNLIKSVYYE